MKRVLMIAYHFPPMRGSSGIQRTLKFAQYLPQEGWQPVVLSANPRAGWPQVLSTYFRSQELPRLWQRFPHLVINGM